VGGGSGDELSVGAAQCPAAHAQRGGQGGTAWNLLFRDARGTSALGAALAKKQPLHSPPWRVLQVTLYRA